jgi:hypothetical protein
MNNHYWCLYCYAIANSNNSNAIKIGVTELIMGDDITLPLQTILYQMEKNRIYEQEKGYQQIKKYFCYYYHNAIKIENLIHAYLLYYDMEKYEFDEIGGYYLMYKNDISTLISIENLFNSINIELNCIPYYTCHCCGDIIGNNEYISCEKCNIYLHKLCSNYFTCKCNALSLKK